MRRPPELVRLMDRNCDIAAELDDCENGSFWVEDIEVMETLATLTYEILVGNIDAGQLSERLKGH